MAARSSDGTKRSKNPFRGVLEKMAETHVLKVEMGLLDADAESKELVRCETGEVYGVTLKRMKPVAKK